MAVNNIGQLERQLWGAADELRANSKLKSSEYSVPVLGLIFLRYADHKFAHAKVKLIGQGSGRRSIGKTDYHDIHKSAGKFDFVMANPPFNGDKERLNGDARYPFGLPKTDKANYLWIQDFCSALNGKGRGQSR